MQKSVDFRFVGNPVDVISGNKYQYEEDYQHHDTPLAFARHYNSQLSDNNVGLGHGWRHSYQIRLYRYASDLLIEQSDGSRLQFTADGFGEFAGNDESHGRIEEDGRDYYWYLPDGSRYRFRGSFPVELEIVGRSKLSLLYRSGRLHQVSDDQGNKLTLDYHLGAIGLPPYSPKKGYQPSGHLASVTMPDGTTMQYHYSGKHDLTAAAVRSV